MCSLIGWEQPLESPAKSRARGMVVTLFTVGDVRGTFSWLHVLYAQTSHMSIPKTQVLRSKRHILMKRTAKLYNKGVCHACINLLNSPNS